MRICLTIVIASVLSLTGCTSTNAPQQPPPPIATGYGSQADQVLGQSLAALRAFTQAAKDDFLKLTPSQQAEEKIPLNSLIMAVDSADQTYLAFHNGIATLQQAQDRYKAAQQAQSSFNSSLGARPSSQLRLMWFQEQVIRAQARYEMQVGGV